MTCRKLSGSIRSPRAVEPLTSQKRTVTTLRTSRAAAASASRAPHESQNLAPSRFSAPQLGQTSMCESRRVFTAEYRDRVRNHVLALAESDPRVVAGAAVGSLTGQGDRWSDLDLTFGVEGSVENVLEEWTVNVLG